MRKIILLFIGLVFINGCVVNRPYNAAQEYCDCYKKYLIEKVGDIEIQGICDSQVAQDYNEINIIYFNRQDTSNWLEVRKFYYDYVDYKVKICGATIGINKDSTLSH